MINIVAVVVHHNLIFQTARMVHMAQVVPVLVVGAISQVVQGLEK